MSHPDIHNRGAIEQLFLDTMRDLREKGSSTTSYDLLRASGLLRQLLIDAHPLVDQVNRTYRLKLEFETFDFTFKLPIPLQFVDRHWMSLDASSFPNAKKLRVDRSRLLSAPLLTHKGVEFTVHELIQTAAHIWGGVHSGMPKSSAERGLSEMQVELPDSVPNILTRQALDCLRIDAPIPDAIAALRGVIAVVIRGLEPLEQAVIQARETQMD